MDLSLLTCPELGKPVRLVDGSLAVIVGALTPGRVLVVGFGGTHEVSNEAMQERPAICARCGHVSRWWWDTDFVPLCCCGARPDADWREATFDAATTFIRLAEAKGPVRLTPILGQALATGGWEHWRQLQRFAFVEAVPGLLVAWNKQQQESQG